MFSYVVHLPTHSSMLSYTNSVDARARVNMVTHACMLRMPDYIHAFAYINSCGWCLCVCFGVQVFMPSHRLASRRVLKALDSADAGVRQAAVGALGSMHQIGHWRYFTTEWNPRATRAEGRRLGRDGGLLTGVTNRLFHKNQSTRLSASCAIFEMCSMCKEEHALSPRIRSVKYVYHMNQHA